MNRSRWLSGPLLRRFLQTAGRFPAATPSPKEVLPMMTDIEIAQSTPLCPIAEIAAKAGIPATAAEPYGSN